MSSPASAASALAAASSCGVEVGERNISVSDKMADSSRPAISCELGVMPCSLNIWYKMVAVQPTGTLRK